MKQHLEQLLGLGWVIFSIPQPSITLLGLGLVRVWLGLGWLGLELGLRLRLGWLDAPQI